MPMYAIEYYNQATALRSVTSGATKIERQLTLIDPTTAGCGLRSPLYTKACRSDYNLPQI